MKNAAIFLCANSNLNQTNHTLLQLECQFIVLIWSSHITYVISKYRLNGFFISSSFYEQQFLLVRVKWKENTNLDHKIFLNSAKRKFHPIVQHIMYLALTQYTFTALNVTGHTVYWKSMILLRKIHDHKIYDEWNHI